MNRSPHKSSDEGFTLVELLVVIGTLALMTAVVAASITVVFRSEGGVVRLVAESHDTQQGVNFFPLDVQAGPVEVAAYDTSAGAAGCIADGSTNVLQFDKGDKRVAYRLTVADGLGRLDRHLCDLPLLTNLISVNVADRLDGSVPQPAAATVIPAAGTFVESIELRLSQDRTDALVVASPRGEPRNSPGDCATNNPIEAAHGYGTFVEGDVELRDGEMTGWLGLGGALTWRTDFTVASDNMSAVSPAYGLYAEEINWSGALPVTELDVASGLATGTVASHGYASGQQVIINGTGNTDIDGNAFTIAVVDPDTFTFTVSTADTSGLTGTALNYDPVTNLDVLLTVASATVASHGYASGQQVIINGTGNTDIDGNAFTIAVVDPDTFTFSVSTADTSGLTGTARIHDPVVLEVGREKAAIGGVAPAFVKIGDLVYESNGSLDNYIDISGPGNPPAESTAGQIDFPLDFDELRDCAAQLAQLLDICSLAGCANEVAVTVTPPPPAVSGTINACSTSPIPQVLNVPEQYFDGNWNFTTSGPGCQGFSQTRPLIINVIDDGDGVVNFDTTPVDWTALGDRKNILFNFPNSTVVNINSGFYGHVLAPFAHVTTNGNIDGGIIARQWTHVDGIVDSNDDLYNNPITWP